VKLLGGRTGGSVQYSEFNDQGIFDREVFNTSCKRRWIRRLRQKIRFIG
jgi:hypothetical protein